MNRRNFILQSVLVGATIPGMLTHSANLSASQYERIRSAGRVVVDGSNSSTINSEFIEHARTGGVHCIHKSVHEMYEYGLMWDTVDKHTDELAIATTVPEILDNINQGKLSLILGSQHGMVLEKMMDKKPMMIQGYMESSLRAFYQLGLRCQGIAYNVNNIFGGGCLEPASPLTREGKRLVESIHKLNILLDVGGHTGEQTSLDAIAMSAGIPVVCTHTNAAALTDNPRASSDKVLEAIAGTGGVVGITAINDFMVRGTSNYRQHGERSRRGALSVMLDQYDYLKHLIGIDHIGMGPDFFWPTRYHHQPEQSITFPTEVLSKGLLQTVSEFENVSQVPNLIAGLRQRGWSEPELDKVLGGNWLRVYRQVWSA